MVVQGILALALALPTGLLFGVGYGTGVRIGYEQVYPLLFPKDKDNRNVTPTVNNIKQINGIYNTIGGKEASQMGIAMGLQGAMEEIDRNPDFQALEALELRLSGRTQSRSGTEAPLKEISISDFPSGSSANPNSPNYNPAYELFLQKEKQKNQPTIQERKEAGNVPFPTGFDFATKKPAPTAEQLAHAKQLREDAEWTAWSTKAGKLKLSFSLTKTNYLDASRKSSKQHGSQGARQSALGKFKNQLRDIVSQLRAMSNDYRSPNNNIRKNALTLRQEIANGNYKY